MEGEDVDAGPEIARNSEPQQHFHIVNRSHALQTEMILFQGGWLSLRQHSRNKPGEARMINLGYVDPEPTVTRFFAKRLLLLSGALAAAAILCATLAFWSILVMVTLPAAILLLTGAGVAFIMCAYRTRKDVTFHTRYGRAPVIALMATLGSFRTMRSVTPQLIEAIEKARIEEPDSKKRYRNEMREHYRLRECGVIDEVVCTHSTQRILHLFE